LGKKNFQLSAFLTIQILGMLAAPARLDATCLRTCTDEPFAFLELSSARNNSNRRVYIELSSEH
jgi:hypothetical protein